MKKNFLSLLDIFLWRNGWFIYLFLDNQWIRRIFLNSYFLNRPKWFERYYEWKPTLGSRKQILIVKTDAIGDYLLFRNLLEDISGHFRPLGYKIHLLGNTLWKDLALELDSAFVDQFFWLEKQEFNKPLADQYRIGIIQKMNTVVYESVFYPNFSREKLAGDWIVNHIPAKVKIGFMGDTQNQPIDDLNSGSRSYSRLVEPISGTKFEFERNCEIVSVLLGKEPLTKLPFLKLLEKPEISKKYVVLFPGASTPLKQWPISRFVELASWLHFTFGFQIQVAGGPEDLILGAQIMDSNPGFVDNLVGKTSLTDLVRLIGNSSMVISNDTSAVHIGAQTGVPTICIFKVNNYGRFLPYPEAEFPNLEIAMPMELKDLSFDQLTKKYSQNYGEDIEKVTIEEVKQKVREVLKS